mmetsp:Transcript_85905/g.276323  ORF Transcript_85905/g.276323 Transcript_85905/m.276323 type:complete len:203 (-) Transcript_85905:674-1282(-)
MAPRVGASAAAGSPASARHRCQRPCRSGHGAHRRLQLAGRPAVGALAPRPGASKFADAQRQPDHRRSSPLRLGAWRNDHPHPRRGGPATAPAPGRHADDLPRHLGHARGAPARGGAAGGVNAAGDRGGVGTASAATHCLQRQLGRWSCVVPAGLLERSHRQAGDVALGGVPADARRGRAFGPRQRGRGVQMGNAVRARGHAQ